ncbi:PREDICTED: uncharacterized protein LOC104588968 isoform X2 [Nelumbo nucifera]|uniref:Uncharacterized protein LOC104588968 isoform X2 n=1 Tax=Nelumbo nucifera TaxID=4432 RepID=A0A1U7Z0B9_NELNU|nr:PREDICTED: uncharacterized protein LOC104588968 isoform X2 [Nelumbo nucifera]
MAADVVIERELAKSCCAVLKERFLKSEEKRNALRQAVKLLEHQIDKLQSENLNLKKSYEEERARAELEREAKVKESTIRVGLENEVSNLKSEIALLQSKGGSRDEDLDREVIQLRTCVSDDEVKINQIKALLEKEKKKADAEKKKADAEKKKAAEAWKMVKAEKIKAEEQKRLADVERSRAEDYIRRLEASKQELNEAKGKLNSEISKTEDANRRLEAEKQKVNKEKKRAESEVAKTEEMRKCAEAQRKKAAEEKNRAEDFSQKLEEERRRNEALQKEILETKSHMKMEKMPPVPFDLEVHTTNGNIKVLEKQLKLKKMQVKHAKRQAKLEKVQKNLLQQEVHRLRQEFSQFNHRLNILDGCCSHSREGLDGSAKANDNLNLQLLNLKNKLSGTEPWNLYQQSKIELGRPHYTINDDFENLGSTPECTGPFFPISGESFTEPVSVSGISSDLQSLIGGSVRNKSQSSCMYSTTASFSDRELVGSHGRGSFSVKTSEKLVEENSKQGSAIPGFAGKVTKLKSDKKLAVVNEDDITPVHRKPKNLCSKSNDHENSKASGRKKKRMQDAVECIEYLYSEDKRLHLQIEKKLSSLHDMLNHKNNLPPAIFSRSDAKPAILQDGKCLVSKSFDDLHAKNYGSRKRRKVSEKKNFHPCTDNAKSKQMNMVEIEDFEDAAVYNLAVSPVNCLRETHHPCREETIDAVVSSKEKEICFENVSTGDYMKLLELDNTVDEERYRMAIENPLSPDLPEIKIPSIETFERDFSICLSEEGIHRKCANDNFIMSCSFDVIDVEIDSNLHKVGGLDMGMEMAKQILISGTEETQILFASNSGFKNVRNSKYCVVFSSSKKESNISRILCATESCLSRSSMASQTDWAVQKILLALMIEQNLLPEEKVCVFFSSLLHNFAVVTSVKFRNFLTSDAYLCSDSFAAHIKAVMDDMETRCMFFELCQLEILLSLVENFLIDGQVMVYSDAQFEPLVPPSSTNNIFSDDITMFLSSKRATHEQFIAGSIILASICAAVDYTSFICEASYNILRMCKSDYALMLKVLHVFAYLCREKYFTLSNFRLVMATIKSLVLVLEGGNSSFGIISTSSPTTCDNWTGFHKCGRCPFSESAFSVDEITLFLLEKLQSCAIPGIKNQHEMEHPDSLNYTVLPQMDEVADEISQYKEGLCILDLDFDISCSSYDCESCNSVQSRSVIDRTLSYLSDILSLVELIACSMNWNWTCRRIIPHLLKILESCTSEKFAAAILVLLGQLGRLGIVVNGYEQMEVEELRCTLSGFLDQDTSTKWGFPTQFATVNALTSLLALDFRELVECDNEHAVTTSRSVHANILRKWFSRLSKEHKRMLLGLF